MTLTEEPETAPVRRSTPMKKLVTYVGIALVALLGSVLVVHYVAFAAARVSTDDAQLASDVVQIAPQVTGTVLAVPVAENAVVHKGDVLLQLDDATLRAGVAQAEANLQAAVAAANGAGSSVNLTTETSGAQLVQAHGAVDQTDSAIAGARADAQRAAAGVTNARAMARGAVAGIQTAQAGLEGAKIARDRAKNAVTSAQANLEMAKANVRAAQAAVTAAQAVAEKADHDAQRYAELRDKGAVSAQAVEQATMASRTAAAQVDAAKRQVEAAQAVVDARGADLQAAQSQVTAAESTINQAAAQLSVATESAHAATAGIAQAQAQQSSAQQAVQQAVARRSQAVGQLTQAQSAPQQVAVSRSGQTTAQAKIAQARAALDTARIELSYACMKAPCDGVVSAVSVHAGSLVTPAFPVMVLVPANGLYVKANFKETQLTHLLAGMKVELYVDAFPGHTFHGKVDSVSPATGATFALLPPDNATGNFTKVVQRVPVKITLDPDQSGLDPLRAGMNVSVTVFTR